MNLPLIVWAQFLFTHAVFVGARYMVAFQGGENPLQSFSWEFPGQNGDTLGMVFLAVAAVDIFLAFLLPKLLHKEKPTMAALQAPPVNTKKIPVLFILQLVMAEMASLLGLFYSFIRGNPHLLLPFVVMGLLATLACFPSKQHLERLA